MKRKEMPQSVNEQSREQDFLRAYDASQYERPSVTADIIIFTVDEKSRLSLLLIRRGGHPYKDRWALPGGFLNAGQESADAAAARELFEETGIQNAYLKQLYTFSDPDRDPRTHVISIAYTALIPQGKLQFKAGDDAKDARLFAIYFQNGSLSLVSGSVTLSEEDLAFDHAEIIKTAIRRLRGRIDYEPDAFELLQNKAAFTIFELKQIFETIKDTSLDTANFRKMFFRNYVNTGIASSLGQTRRDKGRRAAALYCMNQTEGGKER